MSTRGRRGNIVTWIVVQMGWTGEKAVPMSMSGSLFLGVPEFCPSEADNVQLLPANTLTSQRDRTSGNEDVLLTSMIER